MVLIYVLLIVLLVTFLVAVGGGTLAKFVDSGHEVAEAYGPVRLLGTEMEKL